MADGGHVFTNCTGKIMVGGELDGFVEADFKLEQDLGKYVEQGSNHAVDHVFGLRKVSGKITKAWGINSGYLWDWLNNKEEKDIVFQPTVLGDEKLYQCSGCALKSLGSSIKGGGSEPLMIDADFEGLTYGSTDDHTII